ncbi:MAG: GNAT family N-acetyltransferase [Myxococcales bacterium]|jgi:ribosomal-protein-alanine N-acetyltransferase
MGVFQLSSPRLVIDELREEDFDALAELFADPEAMRYFPHPYAREEVRELFDRQRRGYRERGFGLWAVRLKATGDFVGDCGLSPRAVDDLEHVEVGWHLLPRHWHQGYATEAAREVVRHAFEERGLDHVISLIRPENEPSRRVARRLGMRAVGETVHAGLRHLVYRLDAR